MTAPTELVSVCFQFVTEGGAVVDTEPEDWVSIDAATKRAKEWMDMKGQTIAFTSFDGDGAVVRTDKIEHIAVMPAAKMAAIYQAEKEGATPNE